MSLTASGIGQIGWTYTKTNAGFTDSQQGPDSLSGLFGFEDANSVFVEERTLIASATHNYDLTNLVDFFGDPIVFAKILGIIIQCTDGVVFAYGAASNAFQFPNIDLPTDIAKIEIKKNSTFFFGTDLVGGGVVNSTHKNVLIEEISGTDPATYKIVFIGILD